MELNTSPSASTSRKRKIREALLKFSKESFQSLSDARNDGRSNSNGESDHLEAPSRLRACSTVLAPISPTPPILISAILPKLNIDRDSIVVDLGCGDGRWILAIYKEYGCWCFGCDIDEERLYLASEQIDAALRNTKNTPSVERRIKVVKKDVFEFLQGTKDEEHRSPPLLNVVDVLIVYLFRKAMYHIVEILREHNIVPLRRKKALNETNLSRVISIVSVGFALPSYIPIWQDQLEGIRIYLYQAERFDDTLND